MVRYILYAALFILSITASYVRAEDPGSVLTLDKARSLVLERNPEIAASAIEIKAKEAQALQAGLIPNPEINVTMENFGGSKSLTGFQGSETTFELSQMIELGGKRAKRKRAGSLETGLARWDFESKKADILLEVTKSFVDVLTAQERLALKEEIVRLSEEIYNVISIRVSSGKVSPVEETKAGVALSAVRAEKEKTRRELEAARKRLSALWGDKAPSFAKAEGKLDAFMPAPSYEDIEKLVMQNPDIARWSQEKEQKNAVLKLEESKKIQDPTVSLGMRYLNENNDNAFVFGVAIPLPLFNRNQGGVLEARQRLDQAEQKQNNATLRILAALAEAYQLLAGSYTEAETLKKEILPGALSAFEATKEGYLQGKFNYLDVLDAQRTFFEARNRYIETLSVYHKAFADVKRLTGERMAMGRESEKEKA